MSLPATNFDDVDWRDVSFEAFIEEPVVVNKADEDCQGNNNDGNDDENLGIELLVSPPEAVKFFDKLVHVDAMSTDNAYSLLGIYQKMESLTTHQRRF